MLKLTITQERPSEHGDYTFTEKTEFMSEELTVLTNIIIRLEECNKVHETTYRIERVGENDGIQKIKGR